MPEPGYRRGTGPNQLPQGGATQANAGVPTPTPGPSLQPEEIPVEYSGRPEVAGKDMRDSENMQLLTGPADPNFVQPPPTDPRRLPRFVVRNLPLYAAGIKDPEAPPAMRAMYKLLLDRLQKEQDAEGA